MNSRYENDSSQGMALEDLVQMNGTAMAVMDEIPYQPMVYAIPSEWLESWKSLLDNAVLFQPTLYKQLKQLATQEELQNQQVQIRAALEVAKLEMQKSLDDLRKQDGKVKENFYSELSKRLSAEVTKIEAAYSEQQKKNLRYMGITVASSAVLSALVSGLFLLLAS